MNTYELHKAEKIARERGARRNKVICQTALWFSLVVGIGLVVGGVIYLVSRQQSAPTTGPTEIESAIFQDDWFKGTKEAKTVLIEYSDFQCPACAFYYPVLNKLLEEFDDRLAIVYRHFPLPNHQHAKPMAYAAEAAGKQGKFWEMHNMIFDNQKKWANQSRVKNTALEYAKSLGLNLEQFEKDFSAQGGSVSGGEEKIKQKVERHYREGVKAGINSTPTFFLNGQMLSNPRNYEEFRGVIIQAANVNP